MQRQLNDIHRENLQKERDARDAKKVLSQIEDELQDSQGSSNKKSQGWMDSSRKNDNFFTSQAASFSPMPGVESGMLGRPVIPVHRKKKPKKSQWNITEKEYKEIDIDKVLQGIESATKDNDIIKEDSDKEIKVKVKHELKHDLKHGFGIQTKWTRFEKEDESKIKKEHCLSPVQNADKVKKESSSSPVQDVAKVKKESSLSPVQDVDKIKKEFDTLSKPLFKKRKLNSISKKRS